MLQRYRALLVRIALACGVFVATAGAQPVLYVNAAAPAGGTGSAWDIAFRDLQDALDAAAASGGTITQIWVAAGAYTPDRGLHDQAATFHLYSGLGLFGGFSGDETSLAQRDPAIHPTTLSGDLRHNDGPNFANTSDNSSHVVTATGTDDTAILDGFTVTGGNAIALGGPDSEGGGLVVINGTARVTGCRFVRDRANFGGALHCDGASPRVAGCTFEANAALTSAGAVFNYSNCAPVFIGCSFSANTANLQAGAIASSVDCQPVLLNCGFYGNQAATYGGGAVLNNNGHTVFVNCVFSGNVSAGTVHGGGAVRNERGNSDLLNCTLYGNSASSGGGIYNFNQSTANLANCILWGNTGSGIADQAGQIAGDGGTPVLNHCCVQGWTGSLGGSANFGLDPLFVDPAGPDNVLGTLDDLPRVSGCDSPCTDTGDNAALPPDQYDLDGDGNTIEPLPVDFVGQARIYGGHVDRGAYETTDAVCLRGDLNCDGVVNFRDINPFVLYLSNFSAWQAAHPACAAGNGDVNGDGTYPSFQDINPFVALLSGGGSSSR